MKKSVKASKTTVRIRATKPKREVHKAKPEGLRDNIERSALWCLNLGAESLGDIAQGINTSEEEARAVLERLGSRGFAEKKSFGGYRLTESGAKQAGTGRIELETRLVNADIRHGQETDLWITAKNAGAAPLDNAMIQIISPKFVDVGRFSAGKSRDDERNIMEFALAQLHPGETQHVNFKIRGFLTNHALASTYKLEIRAMSGLRETARKELDIGVRA